jgi:hypothetical protein
LKTGKRSKHQEHDSVEYEFKIIHQILGRVSSLIVNDADKDGHKKMNQQSYEG